MMRAGTANEATMTSPIRPIRRPRRRTSFILSAGGVMSVVGLLLIASADLGQLGCGRIDTVVGAVDAAACVPTSFYIDIASATVSGGFSIQTDPGLDGGADLLPPAVQSQLEPGDASAAYAFNVGCTGDYLLWGRIRGPAVESNSFWFRIDDGMFYQWRLSTGVIWYWKAATSGTDYGTPLHFTMDAGTHQLLFRNSSPDVGLGGLYVAVPGDVPPGNDTHCNPPNSIQLADGGCELSCGSAGGNTCKPADCAGRPMFVVYDCAACCRVGDAGFADAEADVQVDGGPRDAGTD